MVSEPKVLLDGLVFPEAPRWRENKLWFSDVYGSCVMSVDLEGKAERIVEVPNEPSGLGWLPDGRLLIVSMKDRRLLRLDPDGLSVAADLSNLVSHNCNDMVVDQQGRAYIGSDGFDYAAGEDFAPAQLLLVTPDGHARIVADGVEFPNGAVITPDGRTLIVGETFGACLTAFDIEPDGSLANRRTWARLEAAIPDGICLDAEGAIWVASPISSGVMRVREGGEVTDRINVATQAFACMLGGHGRNTLFIATCETDRAEEAMIKKSGRIEIVEVEVPGAGIP